jgi:hypothetical protein
MEGEVVRVGTLAGVALYVCLVGCYVPWLVASLRYRWWATYPLIFFCFVGLFAQNVVGSLFVILPDMFGPALGIGRRYYFSWTYYYILVVQMAVFCVVTGLYMFVRRTGHPPLAVHLSIDRPYAVLLGAVCAVGAAAYVAKVGIPPLVLALTGQLTGADLIRSRLAASYAMSDYSLYFVATNTFPSILAFLSLILAKTDAKRAAWYYVTIALCVFVVGLPAGKATFIDVIVGLIVCWLLIAVAELVPAIRRRSDVLPMLVPAVGGMMLILTMYGIYYADMNTGLIVRSLVYRMFVINSEGVAAAVTYADSLGQLAGATLPNIRGLLDFEHVNLSRELHLYMYGPGGGVPVSAVAEGYVNFGWLGMLGMAITAFALVAGAEEVLRWLPRNALTGAVLVLYAMFATKIAYASISASLLSMTFTAAICLLYGMYYVLYGACKLGMGAYVAAADTDFRDRSNAKSVDAS